MLKNRYEPNQRFKYIRYGRMSSDKQNPRSPNQQFDTIEATKKRCGYPWQHVADYRDDAIKGLYVRKRPALQRMLKDIRDRRVVVDLILVDTFERFGRAEEMSEIRRQLFVTHGILLLTADSNFADPNSVSGQALTAVESIRSKEDTRVKAHNVLRGKRDTAREGHWPGGAPPFGYRLETVLKEVKGRQEVDHSRLVPDPETEWILKLLFAKAKASGWGRARLTRWLNAQPEIPKKFKPFKDSAVAYWLQSKIYIGTLIWERFNTGIVNDTRVYQANQEAEWTVISNFCEGLVSREDWEAVEQLRRLRAARVNRNRPHSDGKIIAPLAPGLVLKYPLTGLVRCDECGRSMTPSSSRAYTTAAGAFRRYVSYSCPAAASGVCKNKQRVPEAWLRQTVIGTLIRSLLHPDGETDDVDELPIQGKSRCKVDDLKVSPAFQEILTLVQQELTRLVEQRPSRAAALEDEKKQIQQQIVGWTVSLGRHDLDDSIRRGLEASWKAAAQRQREIEQDLLDEGAIERRQQFTLDSREVAEQLEQLVTVLGTDNATAVNFELALHIEEICCSANGHVELRICKLGIVPDVIDLIRSANGVFDDQPARPVESATGRRPWRRRTRLALNGEDLRDKADLMEFALDPRRFYGLPPQFFWTRNFDIPKRQNWHEQHGDEVRRRKVESGLSNAKLALEFGVSVPTLRKALKFGNANVDRGAA